MKSYRDAKDKMKMRFLDKLSKNVEARKEREDKEESMGEGFSLLMDEAMKVEDQKISVELLDKLLSLQKQQDYKDKLRYIIPYLTKAKNYLKKNESDSILINNFFNTIEANKGDEEIIEKIKSEYMANKEEIKKELMSMKTATSVFMSLSKFRLSDHSKHDSDVTQHHERQMLGRIKRAKKEFEGMDLLKSEEEKKRKQQMWENACKEYVDKMHTDYKECPKTFGGYKKRNKKRKKTRRKKKRKRRRKRCSTKRLKQKMICYRGTKKTKKVRGGYKKIKLRLTKCSKKRLKNGTKQKNIFKGNEVNLFFFIVVKQ